LKRIGSILASLVLLTSVQAVSASSFIEMSVSEMTQQSSAAYRARVLDLETSLKDEMPIRIYRLEVLEVFKGRSLEDPVIKVVLPGGQVDGAGLRVSGIPEIEMGKEYVFFVAPSSSENHHRLTGWSAYQVVEGQRGQRFVVKAPEAKDHAEESARVHQMQSIERASEYESFVDEIFWSQQELQ
jgi:hypothetical protein